MRTVCLYIIRCVLAVAVLSGFAACDKDAHEGERGLAVALDNSRCADVPIGAVRLCVYDTGGNLAATYDYADAQGIAAALLPIEAGHYTVAVVINADKELTETATLAALHEWLASASDTDKDLLSGMAETDVAAEGVTRVTVPLQKGAFTLPVLRLLLTLPEPKLPDYIPAAKKSRAAEAGYTLRCVAELCRAGTDNVVPHKTVTPEPQPDGTYLVELAVPEGDYDLRLWTDYTRADAPLADTYYHTESLKAVTIATDPYTANTDAKDAAYHSESKITLPEEGTTVKVQLQRPLAKYRIIADDVEVYRKLAAENPEKYPPIEELTVTVQYEGYLPSVFNVTNGKPIDSVTGITFGTRLPSVTSNVEEVQLTSDWILADTDGSFVKQELVITDRQGNEVNRVGGIRIDYRQGYLTTLRGKFLTEGKSGGGITIDTDWKDIVVEF